MKIVAISDTHCQLNELKLPEGDLLIHAGDLTWKGDYGETLKEIQILGQIAKNFKKTILIFGNHDFLGESNHDLVVDMCMGNGITYLNNGVTTFHDLVIYGSPFTPLFGSWAFMRERGRRMAEVWGRIPQKTDILVTHGPPWGILDTNPRRDNCGCKDLLSRVRVIKPKIHVFGHIHHAYGTIEKDGTMFVNASSCNENYKPINKPIVFDYLNK
jgi:Icc-related predicted phosphoesterase